MTTPEEQYQLQELERQRQNRMATLVEEQKIIADLNRAAAARQQREFGGEL